MKKVFKILSVLAMIFFVACSEDIFLHDGKDGFSTLMYSDDVANMKVYYLDRDFSLTFTLADTVIYRENKEGMKIVQNTDGCYKIIQVSGLTETIVGTICNGENGTNGTNGTNGSDGFSVVVGSISYFDQDNNLLGNIVSFYSDKDRNGILSNGDVLSNSIIVPNGKDGQNGADGTNGVDGKTPTFSVEIIDNHVILKVIVDGGVRYVASFAIPKDGMSPLLKATQTCFGVIYLWYFDNNNDKVYNDGDTWLSENLITNGKNSKPNLTFTCLTQSINLQGANIHYFTNMAIVLDEFKYDEKEGALYLDKSCGHILLPPVMDKANLLFFSFKHGSKKPYDVTVKVVYADNSEEVIKTINLEGNPNFQKNIFDTYSIFEYRADLDNIQFKNVKRIKIVVSLSGKCILDDYYADDFQGVFGF